MRLVPRNPFRLTSLTSLAVLIAMFAASGCLNRRQNDVLEAHLRQHEEDLRSLRHEKQQLESQLAAARRANQVLAAKHNSPDSAIEQSKFLEEQFQVVGIHINPLLTGLVGNQNQRDSQTLVVAFAALDADGHPVRLDGKVRCELLDSSSAADQQPLQVWDFDDEPMRAAWQMLLGTPTFRLELPLQSLERRSESQLRVVFHSAHGDRFEDSITVRFDG